MGGADRLRGVSKLEEIFWKDKTLAQLIRAQDQPSQTAFLTPTDLSQQVGFVVYAKGGEIKRHLHRQLERHLVGTSEVLVVRQGRCEIDLYNDAKELVATRELCAGDIVLLVGGGHGIRMLEDTVFLEVKLGPYIGPEEKELF